MSRIVLYRECAFEDWVKMQDLDWFMQMNFHQSSIYFLTGTIRQSTSFFLETYEKSIQFLKVYKKLIAFTLISEVQSENKNLAAIVF